MAETGRDGSLDGARWRKIVLTGFLPGIIVLGGAAVAILILRGREDGHGTVEVDLHPVLVDDEWGYVDAAGRIVIAPAFESAGEFKGGLAVVKFPGSEGGWGFLDKTGADFVQVRLGKDVEEAGSFSGGLLRVRRGGKWGFVSKRGLPFAIEPAFDGALDFSEGRAAFSKGGRWGYIDERGKTLIEPRYEAAGRFSGGIARIAVPGEGGALAWGFIDARGREIAKPAYAYAGDLVDGRARVKICEPGEEWCAWRFLDGKLEPAFERSFDWAWDFSEGLAAVLDGGRWGYVDPQGNMAVAPAFADAGQFAGGLARVKSGGRWGYVDRSGRIAIKPSFHQASDFTGSLAAVSYVTRSPGSAMEPLQTAAGYVDGTGRFVWNPPPGGAPAAGPAGDRTMWNFDFPTGKIRVMGSFDATTYELKFREESGSFGTLALDLPDPLEIGKIRDVVAGENYTLIVSDGCVAFSLGWAAILAGETALVKARTDEGEVLRNVIVTWLPANARGQDLAFWTVDEDGFFLVSRKGRVHHGSAADPLAPMDEFDLGFEPLPTARLVPRDGMLFVLQPGARYLVVARDERKGWLVHPRDLGWEAMETPSVDQDKDSIYLREGEHESRLVVAEIAASLVQESQATAPE